MLRYKEFAPTTFDVKGLGVPQRQNWLVLPCSRDRDSGCLAQSNFEVALSRLGGESATVEIHRFGHWGPGWFEIILVHPDRSRDIEEIESDLENSPVLDEALLWLLEYETASNSWVRMPLRERITWCARCATSIFAARRDELPDNLDIDRFLGN